MGAYWYLLSTVKLSIELPQEDFLKYSKKPDCFLPQTFQNIFVLNKQQEYEKKPDYLLGKSLKVVKVKLDFLLKDEYFMQYRSFILESWSIIKEITKTSHHSNFSNGITGFINNHFDTIIINKESLNSIDNQLCKIVENYYIRYHCLSKIVVYYGWPKDLYKKGYVYGLEGFHIFSSMNKIQENPEEIVFITDLKREIQSKLISRYPFAKNLYVLGY